MNFVIITKKQHLIHNLYIDLWNLIGYNELISGKELIMMNLNIDEILDKAKEMVDVAAKKTNDAVEVSKLKFDLSKCQSELREIYQELGKKVSLKSRKILEDDVEYCSLFEEIDEILERIDALNVTIADRQNLLICQRCGAKNRVDHLFCSQCGSPLKVRAEREEEKQEEACDGCSCGCSENEEPNDELKDQ